MPEFVEPIVEKVLSVLQARTPALCEARGLRRFQAYSKLFTRVMSADPAVWVVARGTQLDPEQTGLAHESHELSVIVGITADPNDPGTLSVGAMQYIRVIHDALAASWPGDWCAAGAPLANGVVLRVFVVGHDYGPLFEGEARLARFPQVHLAVECNESWGGLEGV